MSVMVNRSLLWYKIDFTHVIGQHNYFILWYYVFKIHLAKSNKRPFPKGSAASIISLIQDNLSSSGRWCQYIFFSYQSRLRFTSIDRVNSIVIYADWTCHFFFIEFFVKIIQSPNKQVFFVKTIHNYCNLKVWFLKYFLKKYIKNEPCHWIYKLAMIWCLIINTIFTPWPHTETIPTYCDLCSSCYAALLFYM